MTNETHAVREAASDANNTRGQCRHCNGYGYFVMAPSTCSPGGERVNCGNCNPHTIRVIPPAQAEASTLPGEVVAWMYQSAKSVHCFASRADETSIFKRQRGWTEMPLYAAPPTTPAVGSGEEPCPHSRPVRQLTGDGSKVDFCPDCGRCKIPGSPWPEDERPALRPSDQDVERVVDAARQVDEFIQMAPDCQRPDVWRMRTARLHAALVAINGETT